MTAGWIAVAFVLVYYATTLWLCRKVRLGAHQITYCGLTCAVAILLTFFRIPLPTPFGTTLTFEYLPLILLAVLVDHRLAVITGFVCGVVAMMISPGWLMFHWAQLPLEQLLCFSCIGYAGMFGRDKKRVTWGVVLAMSLAFLGHFLSGVIFFGQFALPGWGTWAYSLAFNASYMVPELLIAVFVTRALPLDTLSRAIQKGASA